MFFLYLLSSDISIKNLTEIHNFLVERYGAVRVGFVHNPKKCIEYDGSSPIYQIFEKIPPSDCERLKLIPLVIEK